MQFLMYPRKLSPVATRTENGKNERNACQLVMTLQESWDFSRRSVAQQSPSGTRAPRRSMSSGYLGDSHAAAELFLRLNHARQTVSYVRNQVRNPAMPDALLHHPWPRK